MDKTIFKNIKATKLEIQEIQRELQNLPITKDSVHGSMPEFPYIQRTVVIRGVDMQQEDKLRRKLGDKLVDLQRQLAAVEDVLDGVEDPIDRAVIRLYCAGINLKNIGRELGYSESAMSRRLKKILEKD